MTSIDTTAAESIRDRIAAIIGDYDDFGREQDLKLADTILEENVVIPRDKLPQVTEGKPVGWLYCDDEIHSPELTPNMLRRDAYRKLAVAERIEAGHAGVDKRRDELAREFAGAPRPGVNKVSFHEASRALKLAIDRIIELEARA